MQSTGIITTRKNKDGSWVAYDVNGNKATGVTKQIALNNFHLIYGVMNSKNTIAQVNMDEYIKFK